MKRVSIVGLGKLGSSMLAAFASKGFQVVGVEIDKNRAELLRKGKPFHYEENLEEFLTKYKDNISISEDFQEAISSTEATFLVVNTPSKEDGSFSTEQLIPACQKIGEAIRDKDGYHLIVITCTIMPSTTRKEVIPILESTSGKKTNIDFGICYNPEFIALGTVIHDLLNPDFVLIGESDKKAGDLLSGIYEKLIENSKIKRMSLENAEVAKIALNSYITLKISFANSLAQLCENIPGGNVDAITESLGLDRRIGKHYLKGAVSFGGPCFPRDNRAFLLAAKNHGCNLELPQVVDKINQNHIEHIAELALNHCNGGKVAFLGGSYKPRTDVIESSPPIEIAKFVAKRGIKVSIHDPQALKNIQREYGSVVQCCDSLADCIKDAEVCVIVTPWEQYKSLKENDFKGMKGSVIIDCWKILDIPSNSKYNVIKIGVENSNLKK